MLDKESLDIIIQTWREFAERKIPLDVRLKFDREEIFPEQLVRELLSPEVGMHLIFIPEEYGGMGGGAYDVYRISEEMAKTDLGIATAFLAIALGTDPIRVGATPEQKNKWMRKIAENGLIVAYGATEPQAGSNLANLKTKAEPIQKYGKTVAYRLNGTKQFISNGRFADLYTILAMTPGGPSFFVVEKGMQGLIPGRSEEKHGIRASNTSQVILEDCEVPIGNLVGEVEGQGLVQASQVFAFTRLMVAAFGLGGGVAAVEKAIPYAKERIQFGTPLIEKQGYTHKLIVPHAVRLEAARAYIEEVARRLDKGEHNLPTEGSIAKYLATEYGNAAAEDAIQALGGYGYTHEYEVEKIKRDVRITTIYEGTSEIQQSIIGINRWRESLQSKLALYENIAKEMEQIDSKGEFGGLQIACAARALNATIAQAKEAKLTRQQHIQFLLADIMAKVEVGTAFVRKCASSEVNSKTEKIRAMSRVYAREVAEDIANTGLKIIAGSNAVNISNLPKFTKNMNLISLYASLNGMTEDMDKIANYLKEEY